jgi:hypothetical protein
MEEKHCLKLRLDKVEEEEKKDRLKQERNQATIWT